MNDDIRMRPEFLADYKGQDRAKQSLDFYIKAAKMRGMSPTSALICPDSLLLEAGRL